MKKKITLIITVFFLLVSCEYQPIYSNSKLKNIEYRFIEQKGDQQINKLVIRNFKRKQAKKSAKLYKIKIETKFSKIILTKDNFGSPTDYKLVATSNFIIESGDKELSFIISENFVYKNLQTNYDQSNYENSIKKNLAARISEKLRTKLLTY